MVSQFRASVMRDNYRFYYSASPTSFESYRVVKTHHFFKSFLSTDSWTHAGISVKGYPIQLNLTNGPMHIEFGQSVGVDIYL